VCGDPAAWAAVGARRAREEETEATLEFVAGGDGAGSDFYSYGEISPHTTGDANLHNQLMMLTVLGEMA